MYKRGDTLIEVMFAVGIFGLAAVGAISLMNAGLASTQNSLETTMARQEIDAQAEALRFIHDAYLTEPNTKSTDGTTGEEISTNNFRNLWQDIVAQAYYPSTIATTTNIEGASSIKHVEDEDPDFFTRTVDNKSNCDTLFTTSTSNGSFGIPSQSFIINPRGLNLLTEKDSTTGNTKILSHTDIRQNILISAKDTYASFTTAATYPRLLYGTDPTNDDETLSDASVKDKVLKNKGAITRLDSSEGIWVTAVASDKGLKCYDQDGKETGIRPDFYDFHIQTCWDSVSGNASVISSTVRLFNPDQVNLRKQGMITFDEGWVDFDKILETCGKNDSTQSTFCEADPNNAGGFRHRASEDGVTYPDDHTIQHSIFENNPDNTGTIHFNGYHISNMDEGRYTDLTGETVVDIKLNAKSTGYTGHTNGTFHLSIGRIGDPNTTTAAINEKGGTIVIDGTDHTMGQNFGIWLHYDHGTYTVYAANDTDYTNLGDANIIGAHTDAEDNGDIRITLWYTHSSHNCNSRDSAVIENISISRPEINDATGGCVKTTPKVTEGQESIVDNNGDTAGPGTQPEPDVEETQVTPEAASTGKTLAMGFFGQKSSSALTSMTTMTYPTFSAVYEDGFNGINHVSDHDNGKWASTVSLAPNPTINIDQDKFVIYLTGGFFPMGAYDDISFKIVSANLSGPGALSSIISAPALFGPIQNKDAKTDDSCQSSSNNKYWIVAKGRRSTNSSSFYFSPINVITQCDPSTFL